MCCALYWEGEKGAGRMSLVDSPVTKRTASSMALCHPLASAEETTEPGTPMTAQASSRSSNESYRQISTAEDSPPGPGPVARGHLDVQLLNSTRARQVAELLVHVVCSGPRVVPQPDCKVLDLGRLLLKDLSHREDLTVRLLQLALLGQKVPEPRLGNLRVGRKQTHPVHSGLGVSLSRLAPSKDLELFEVVVRHFVR